MSVVLLTVEQIEKFKMSYARKLSKIYELDQNTRDLSHEMNGL